MKKEVNEDSEDGYMHDKDESASTASVKVQGCPSGLYLRKAIRIDRRSKQLNGRRVKKTVLGNGLTKQGSKLLSHSTWKCIRLVE